MIRIILVDDQPLVRQGLRMRLALEEDITVVGEAGDGPAALALVNAVAADVVIMDVEMPLLDGIDTATRLQGKSPVAVVMMSMHDDQETRARSLAAGAVAFVSKQAPFQQLLLAVRQAATRRSEDTF